MTISLWRYSHLVLAISSAIFLSIASVTGIILALEPMSNAVQPYAIGDIENITIAETIAVLQREYKEVITITVEDSNFVVASVITKEGKGEKIYVNPRTGEKLGNPEQKASIFKFATNLHRSLFLKSVGRFFVGLVSLLLVIIVVTGMLLILKRQGGVSKFFTKVHKESTNQYYHVVFGRWFFIPILIIAVTGVYLSLEKFSLLPKYSSSNQINIQAYEKATKTAAADFPVFRRIHLNDVRNIEFPFSDDVEDYFRIELIDKELMVHQFSGSVLSVQQYTFVKLASYYSLLLHTGSGNVLWSIVLLITSGIILFFMYSGFWMTIKRSRRSRLSNGQNNKDECEYIILVGSETGSTFTFANLFRKALLKAGKSVFVSELNSYTTYQKAKHLIVFTATYGKGEPPANAKKFERLFKEIKPINTLQFSVIGLGSLAYPDFCKYAIDVDAILGLHSEFRSILPLQKINNQSLDVFKNWVEKWNDLVGLSLKIDTSEEVRESGYEVFKVANKTPLNTDDTFLLRLHHSKQSLDFRSGDLLSIRPNNDTVARLYSIGKLDGAIVLSIKKHDNGVCSSYLNQLQEGDTIKAMIKPNEEFYFPSFTNDGILIANGTGIAPFLGMITSETSNAKIHLFWGGRTKKSLEIYEDYVKRGRLTKQISSFHVAYSRENDKEYVQDLVSKENDLIANTLQKGGVIMICGSVNMQEEVLDVLERITENKLKIPLSTFLNNKQIRMDCY
ncbi:PepSY domain-containing protein [uncultured Aquimarina sp.]|uniref:PepSY domain-containing protein n=1 Tax=uncultured Aquimarina sp. TaxID=575652 RepID=UPI0026359AE4|nr:PepSY domain-containing protein [uncultured Aquimarina sp.]